MLPATRTTPIPPAIKVGAAAFGLTVLVVEPVDDRTVLLVPTLVLTDDDVVVTRPTLLVVALVIYVPTASIEVEAKTDDDVVEPTLVVALEMTELVVLALVVTLVNAPVDTDVEGLAIDVAKHDCD